MEEGNRQTQDVCEIWKTLKHKHTAKCNPDSFQRLWHGFSNDTHQKLPSQARLHNTVQQLQHSARKDDCSDQQIAIPPTQHIFLDGAAPDRLVQALQSPEASVRRAAMLQIQSNCSATAMSTGQHQHELAGACAKLCKALLRHFDDKSEACRELAVSTVMKILQAVPDISLPMLPYAVPVLEERLHTDEVHRPSEPSEDIRWLLAQLLSLLLEQARSAVAAYASEVWSMTSAALSDSYYEVAITGCQVAQQLAAVLGLRLGQTAEELVAALLPLTAHRRYRVRCAAVEAVRDIVHQGAHKMILEMVAWRDPNLVPIKAFYGDDLKTNFCGKLAADSHAQVRLAFVGMVGSWLLSLNERREHEARLLPYLLNGLCDDSPAVVDCTLQLLEQLGKQYEKEHEQELADVLWFAEAAQGMDEARVVQYVCSGNLQYGAATSSIRHDATASAATATATAARAGSTCHQEMQDTAVLRLPGPFSHRPRLGSRMLAQNNFSTAVGALCNELSSWQLETRARSGRLLLVNLLLVEAAAARHAQVLLPALCATVEDTEVSTVASECATVLGCYCDFQLLLQLLQSRLEELSGSAARQAAVLQVLASVVRGAQPMGRLNGHTDQLRALLSQQGIACSQDSRLIAATAAVAQQLRFSLPD